MMRRGFTLLEVSIGAALLAVVGGVLMQGFRMMTLQSERASGMLGQTQVALTLLETLRLELGSTVMNPVADADDHEGNSFAISSPNASSIQFVTDRQTAAGRQRLLVAYEARRNAKGLLALRKRTWRFLHPDAWMDQPLAGGSFPDGWVGPLIEDEEKKFRDLSIEDLSWQAEVPSEAEARVFVRVKLVLRAGRERLVPLSTLIALPTPDHTADASECPCLMAPGFNPASPDCEFCLTGGR